MYKDGGVEITYRFRWIVKMAVLWASMPFILGQTVSALKQSNLGPVVPPVLKPLVAVLGTRFTTPGYERLTITGSIKRSNAAGQSVKIVYELGRKFYYAEGTKQYTFNGTNGSIASITDPVELGLCESLFEDSIDGTFYNVKNAGFFRLLMSWARLDDGRSKTYTGPYLNIFQLVLPLGSLPNTPKRIKHYYFDSKTQLLDRVRYMSDSKTSVETQFQTWNAITGTTTPTVISRTENGVTQFTVNATSVTTGPAQNDGLFN